MERWVERRENVEASISDTPTGRVFPTHCTSPHTQYTAATQIGHSTCSAPPDYIHSLSGSTASKYFARPAGSVGRGKQMAVMTIGLKVVCVIAARPRLIARPNDPRALCTLLANTAAQAQFTLEENHGMQLSKVKT